MASAAQITQPPLAAALVEGQEPAPLEDRAAPALETPPAEVWGDFENDPTLLPKEIAPPEEELPDYVQDVESFEPGVSQLVERTENADVYVNPDGTNTIRSSATVINKVEPDGSMVPIDTEIVDASAADVPPAGRTRGTPAQDAALKVAEHPLNPVFGETAEDGAVSVSVPEGVSARVAPVNSTGDAEVRAEGDDQLVYDNAIGGSDLTYEVTEDSVKETVTLTGAPGATGPSEWSFWLDVVGGTPRVVPSGAIEVTSASGEMVLALPVPYVFDSAAQDGVRAANDVNGTYRLERVGARWKVTVGVDRAWLNRPDLVYPVQVDPTLAGAGYDGAQSFKSDGVVVQDGILRIGSPLDGGKLWRSVAHFDYGYLLNQNYQLIDVEANMNRIIDSQSTGAGYGAFMHHASSFSFNGQGAQLAVTNSFGDNGNFRSAALLDFMRTRFAANDYYPFFHFAGWDDPNLFTYKRFMGEMYLTVNKGPASAALVAPANGANQVSISPMLQATATDPEGDPIEYYFRVGTTPTPEDNLIWTSGWSFSDRAQLPPNMLNPNTTYYWRAFVRDACSSDVNSCGNGSSLYPVATNPSSFTTAAPPNALTANGALPAPGTVATTTPTLSVQPTTDPDNAPQALKYWFTVTTGQDARTGTVVSSGYLPGTSWTVPAGYLKDGVTYSWTAFAWDGSSNDQGIWSNKLTVDLRNGDPKSSPTDDAGGATVNLANGNLIVSTGSPTTSFAKSEVGLNFTYNSRALGAESGLIATYYQDLNKNGQRDALDKQVLQRTEPTVNVAWENDASPYPGVVDHDYFFAEWDGRFTAPAAGQYLFGGAHDDSLKITVNNTDAYSNGCCFTLNYQPKPITLAAGQTVPFHVELTENVGRTFATVYVKRADGAPLTSQGPTEMPIPASWLSTGVSAALPDGWRLSTDVDGDAAYSNAKVSEQSITLYDASGSPHIYSRTLKDGQAAWNPPAPERGVLNVAPAGAANAGEITLVEEDGSRSVFAPDGTLKGYEPADVTGVATALNYEWTGTPGRLRSITDPISTLQVRMDYQRSGDNCYGGLTVPAGMSGTAPADKLCRITYPDGAISVLWYSSGNPDGRLMRLTDPGNENTDFGYNTNGKLAALRGALANDAITAGVSTVANDDTSRTLIDYDAANRVTAIQGVVSTTGAARPAHRYAYNTAASAGVEGMSTVTEDGSAPASGYTSRVWFNDKLQATSVANALGMRSSTVFNAKDQLERTTDRAGRVSTTVYDQLDRPIASYGPAPGNCFNSDGTVATTVSACAALTPGSTTAYDEGLAGLHTEWFNSKDLSGTPAARTLGLGTGATGPVAANWGTGTPTAGITNPDNFSYRASGYLTFPVAGTYRFKLNADDGARIWINNVQIVDHWNTDSWGMERAFYIDAIPAGAIWPIRIEGGDIVGDARLDLTWQKPGDGSYSAIPAANVTPGYGLPTTETNLDSGGSTPNTVTTSNYGSRPWEGLAVSTTVVNGAGGLTSTATYDDLRRVTATALPGGDITNPARRTSYGYYGYTEPRANPCVSGSAQVNQAGRLKTVTGKTTSSSTQVTTETVYDIVGRVVASRTNTEGWICTTYDTRSRPVTVIYPATADNSATTVDDSTAARTVTVNPAVNGNPLTQSTTDSGAGAGGSSTITTVSDLADRQISYTDAMGTVTTTTYNQSSQVLTETSVAAGSTATSTRTYTYTSDGMLDLDKLDGTTVADSTYNSFSELTSVAYGNSTTGTLTQDTAGRLTSLRFAAPSSVNYTSTVTRSKAGRITAATDTNSAQASNKVAWTYGYDQAGNMTTAALAARTSAAAVSYGYNFTGAPSASCPTGTSSTAAANTNRMTMTRQDGTTAAVTTNYCYDGADRILGIVGSGATSYTYDTRGNVITATTGGTTTTFVYDGANRHVRTVAPNGAGSTVTVTYVRDALNRIIQRTVTGAADTTENGAFRFGYTALDDRPDLNLTATNTMLTRDIVLAGGALIVKDYQTAANTRWHYPNLHGDIFITLTGAGAIDGVMRAYDPYGTPITSSSALDPDAGPNTTQGSFDYGWLGQFQRSAEHTANLNYIEMGARVYDPISGRFYSIDPVADGGANDYAYPTDPIGMNDLDGQWWSWNDIKSAAKSVAKVVAPVAEIISYVPGPIGQAASGAAAAAYLVQGDKKRAAAAAVGMLPGGKYAAMAAKGMARGTKAAKAVCRVNSFTPETLIAMANGTAKPIKDIAIGDLVMAGNALTGDRLPKMVTDVIVGDGFKNLVEVKTGSNGTGTTKTLTGTSGHPFWVYGSGWTAAGQLAVGDMLVNETGSPVRVQSVAHTVQLQTVYNLTVDEFQTYYVISGSDSLLVHNCAAKKTSKKSGKAAASDLPSHLKGKYPRAGQSRDDFLKELFGPNPPKGPGSDYSKMRKRLDRGPRGAK